MKNEFGIVGVRSAQSVMGYAEAWVKRGGKVVKFDTKEEADQEALRMNRETRSPNVSYFAQSLAQELVG